MASETLTFSLSLFLKIIAILMCINEDDDNDDVDEQTKCTKFYKKKNIKTTTKPSICLNRLHLISGCKSA